MCGQRKKYYRTMTKLNKYKSKYQSTLLVTPSLHP